MTVAVDSRTRDVAVAHIADRAVTGAELAEFTERLRAGSYASVLPTAGIDRRRFDRWALQLLLREGLVLHRAGRLPAGRRIVDVPGAELRDAVRQVRAEVTADVRVPAAAVRAYFQRNSERFTTPERRQVRHVLCPDAASARLALREISAGADLAEVAHRCSLDAGSIARSGDLGLVRAGELPAALDAAVFAAPPGRVGGPVSTRLGWHLFRVERVLPTQCATYADVRDDIEAELLAQARADAFRGWLDGAGRELVELSPGFEHPGDPHAAEPSHRH